ncbi:sarcosine oxidase subunit gamma [Methylobrevis pamukkalensis]|uniref:Sarcosine oxidase, gamma subunit family n=1 Tax=Methylobrevis pamukkalensis TaxID=1439726 RepID=A0A1E3GX55_9HYPH|nr:sarcosine oxidase subunit gamma family protein [Methylobrevis pamukkalensis]ODN68630.1 Sarcosine oxidase, gamma subunit family [Methylobrevis pamukkalensis]
MPDALTITRPDMAMATIAVPSSSLAAAEATLAQMVGDALPAGLASVAADGLTLLRTAPARFAVLSETMDGWALERRLRAALGDLALVTDQSDGRAVFRIAGLDARALLETGCALDLDPRALPAGDGRMTEVIGIGALLLAEPTGYLVAVPRSFALSLGDWLVHAAKAVAARSALSGAVYSA